MEDTRFSTLGSINSISYTLSHNSNYLSYVDNLRRPIAPNDAMIPHNLHNKYYPSSPILHSPRQDNAGDSIQANSGKARAIISAPYTTSIMTTTQDNNQPAVPGYQTHQMSGSMTMSITAATEDGNQQIVSFEQAQRFSHIDSTNFMTQTENRNHQTVFTQQTHQRSSSNYSTIGNRFVDIESPNEDLVWDDYFWDPPQSSLAAGSGISQENVQATPLDTPLEQAAQSISFQLMPDSQVSNVTGVKRSRSKEEEESGESVKRGKVMPEEPEDTEMSDNTTL
ncbi:hypothetical protein BZA77DRAFT_318822 [Pyronema omphalodes]|nr:hypothetical protein BZA77DRAFT_318822 [Pyronema omphalodes]